MNNAVARIKDVMKQNDFFEKYNLNRIGVFGSTVRGEESKDIDILIEENINYRQLALLRDELQKHLDKRIDIVMVKYANPIVLHRAMKEVVYVTKH